MEMHGAIKLTNQDSSGGVSKGKNVQGQNKTLSSVLWKTQEQAQKVSSSLRGPSRKKCYSFDSLLLSTTSREGSIHILDSSISVHGHVCCTWPWWMAENWVTSKAQWWHSECPCLRCENDRWHFNGIYKNVSVLKYFSPALPYFISSVHSTSILRASKLYWRKNPIWHTLIQPEDLYTLHRTVIPDEVPMGNTPTAMGLIHNTTNL